jgi:acetylxylan esterase
MPSKITLSSLILAAAPIIVAQSVGTGSCTDVHIFIARGWNEDCK